MRRREFIAGLCGAAGWPLAARAQQRALPVVGFVDGTDQMQALAQELVGLHPDVILTGGTPATAVRVWKKRPELQAHSRFTIQDGCGLPVGTGAVS